MIILFGVQKFFQLLMIKVIDGTRILLIEVYIYNVKQIYEYKSKNCLNQ